MPAAAADTTAPVITVRAPAFNSVNATGYVATTIHVGKSGNSFLSVVGKSAQTCTHVPGLVNGHFHM